MIADRIGRHEVFLPINQKSYNSREWPAYMFVTSLTQHENGDLRKLKVSLNLLKVGYLTLRHELNRHKGV